MELQSVASDRHVNEAIRLFQISTFQAATSNFGDTVGTPQFIQEVKRMEQRLTDRIAIGSTANYNSIVREFIGKGSDENAVRKAIDTLVMRNVLRLKNQRKLIERINP